MPSLLSWRMTSAHLRRLGRTEGCGGLVHDEGAGLEVDDAGDGDGLALTAREGLHWLLEVREVGVEPSHDRTGRSLHRRVVAARPCES